MRISNVWIPVLKNATQRVRSQLEPTVDNHVPNSVVVSYNYIKIGES